MTDRVFLDANVLFSAAWVEGAGLARLWRLAGTDLLSSQLALAEAERNLDSDEQRFRLRSLAAKLTLVEAPAGAALPAGIELVAKDAPILLAAVEAGASHLLTGDQRHFGHLFGKSVSGVRILTPARYLVSR